MSFRLERDTMGEVRVPSDALYGPQTQRAVDNFPISGAHFQRPFIHALGLIKSCAAAINGDADIAQAADSVSLGEHDSHFPVDIFQTGSGTSTNMNANEVIARLASIASQREIHPNDDVNRRQSSNDVIPSAMHIAAALEITELLLPALEALASGLGAKSAEFAGIVKIGRTHLQDAVPMMLGQEFSGYARQVQASAERIQAALDGIYELPLGGTAVGTGVNAPAGFGGHVIQLIAERTGIPFRETRNHFAAQGSQDAVSFLSGALRSTAIALTKIANDIRWLGSGPRCGLGELRLPATQPGSSIMPGKVNPVIAESLLMVCAQVIGYDTAIAWCAGSGSLELNTMMPLIAYDLLESIRLLANGTRNFLERLVLGLEADRERISSFVEQSLAMATALVPEIGYDRAAEVAKEAYEKGKTVREVALERGLFSEDRLKELLDPARMAEPPA